MIQREHNRIAFGGGHYIGDLLAPLAAIHHAIKLGYDEIELDFRSCEAAFAAPMLALCAQVMKMRSEGIAFQLLLPKLDQLARLFQNTSWAHFLDPSTYAQSQFKGFRMVPATQFTYDVEQNQAVTRIANGILGAIPDLDRRELSALEWSVNEITDNVLVHSQSPIGGLVQVSTFERATKRIEYVVADAGLGIPRTLRQSRPELTSDVAAIECAVQEGVTRDTALGQGNGLFGSYQISSHSKGAFHLESGYGKLTFSERTGLHLSSEKIPYEGTLIAAQINFSDPHLLADALKFGGRQHVPMDFVELKYEQHDRDEVLFVMADEASSLGSRLGGTPVRIKLVNLLRMCPGQRIIIDFSGIPLISSSFADEVLGKLFVEIGPVNFAQRFEFRNLATTVKQLIDKAISQRMASM